MKLLNLKDKISKYMGHARAVVTDRAAVHVAALRPDALLPCRPAAKRARRVYVFVSNTSR